MPMKLFNRKSAVEIDDQYLLRFSYAIGTDTKLDGLIESLSKQQLADGQPPLNATWPEASLVTGQELLQAVRDHIVLNGGEVQDYVFEGLDFLMFNKSEKRSKGSNPNPKPILPLKNVKIGIKFRNLTSIVIDGVFTTTEFADTAYEAKVDIAGELLDSISELTNLAADDVAIIPEELTADKALDDGESAVVFPDQVNSNGEDRNDDWDDGDDLPPEIGDEQPKSDDVGGDLNGEDPDESRSQDDNDKSGHAGGNSRSVVFQNKATQPIKATSSVEEVYVGAELLPSSYQFETRNYAVVDAPGTDGYIPYKEDQFKRNANKWIGNAIAKFNADSKLVLGEQHKALNDEIAQSLKDYETEHDPKDGLTEEVEEYFESQYHNQLTNGIGKIEDQHEIERQEAKNQYDVQIQEIDANELADKTELTDQLDSEFTEKKSKRFDEVYRQRYATYLQGREELADKLRDEADNQLDEAALKLASENNDKMNQLFKDLQTSLHESLMQLEIQDSNAREAHASEEKIRTRSFEFDDFLEAKKEIDQLKEAKVTLEAQRSNLLQQNASLTEKNADLDKQYTSLKQIAESAKRDSSSETMNQLLALQIAKESNSQQVEPGQVAAQSNKVAAAEVQANVSRGLKRIAIVLVVLVLFALAGAGAYEWHQHQAYDQQSSKLQSQLKAAKSSKAATTAQKASASATKVTATETATNSQNSTDTAETKAFNDNNLDQVTSSSGAKYQAVDEAILNNNAAWLKSALNQLDGLDLQDSNRVAKAVQLLNDNGMSDLATNVRNSNK